MRNLRTKCTNLLTRVAMHLLGFNRHLYSWIYVRTRTDRDAAKRLFYAIVTRHLPIALGYTVLPWVVFLATFIFLMWLARALLYTPYDFYSAIDSLPRPWDFLVFDLVYYGGSFIVGWIVYKHFRRRMELTIERHITTPLCIHCGFDLSDQAQTDSNSVFCTDCGTTTPYYPAP